MTREVTLPGGYLQFREFLVSRDILTAKTKLDKIFPQVVFKSVISAPMATTSHDAHRRVTFYLPDDETEASGDLLGGTTVILLMSLVAIPLTFFLNTQQWMHNPFIILVVGVLVLALVVFLPYLSLRHRRDCDPVLYVVSLFMFSSAVNLLVAFENDDIIADFVTFFLRDGEPQLKTAHGTMMCYWDGLVHYGIWLMILAAVSWGENYKTVGLIWLGSFVNSIGVFLLGSVLGMFGARWPMLLSIPYIVLPFWIGYKLLKQPRDGVQYYQQTEEERTLIWRRPVDLIFVLYFCLATVIHVFRGMAVLGCKEDLILEYVQHYEPYLMDPSAYPKIQMLVYMFYFVPYQVYAVCCLLRSHQTWLEDWSLIYAGAAAQGQFTHIGSSVHSRTPFKLRVPATSGASMVFWVLNGMLFIVPMLFAYRQNSRVGLTQEREKQE